MEVAEKLLNERQEVATLREFHSLVLEELRRRDIKFRLSAKRLLKLAALSGRVRIRAEKRRSPGVLKHCPLCGGELESEESSNLYGKKVRKGRRCQRCGYSSARENFVPRRYYFFRKRSSEEG